MRTKLNSVVRWAGSLLAGIAVVYVLLVSGLYFSGNFEDEPTAGVNARAVDLLGELDRVRFRDELGLGRQRTRAAPPPPPPVVLTRQVSGFVQLEVEVGTGGNVLDAKVVGSVPEGYYEEQALQEVRLRRYEPLPCLTPGTCLGKYRQTEVVPFTVTVEGPERPAAHNNPP